MSSEVKLAIALASSNTVQQAASKASIRLTTARTYLDRIFRITRTHKQSQLVALIPVGRHTRVARIQPCRGVLLLRSRCDLAPPMNSACGSVLIEKRLRTRLPSQHLLTRQPSRNNEDSILATPTWLVAPRAAIFISACASDRFVVPHPVLCIRSRCVQSPFNLVENT
jgi:hypothetical protein